MITEICVGDYVGISTNAKFYEGQVSSFAFVDLWTKTGYALQVGF